jgi:hypothetical protein
VVGNMAKGIYGNWMGTLNGSWSVGMKSGMKMMIAIVVTSGMYG